MLKLVIFEGIDKAGKTTLFQLYRKATEYQPLCWDRGPGSNIVYDKLYERPDKSRALYKAEKVLEENFIVYLIYCYMDVNTLKERLNPSKEGQSIFLLWEAKMIYEVHYLPKTRFSRILYLDTGRPIEECLDKILFFTGERRKDE